MENLINARAVFRGMWKWPELWAMIIAGTILVRLIVNAGVQEKLAEYNHGQIETIKMQNEQSVQDRQYLHEELRASKDALKRLERAVKTGEYP